MSRCKGKVKRENEIVASSSSTNVINTTVTASSNIEERLKNLEQQVAKLQLLANLENENQELREEVSRRMQYNDKETSEVIKDNTCLVVAENSQNIDNEIGSKEVTTVRKKNKMNKQMRARCWTKYVGEDVARTKCLCCNEQTITTFTFECGHVVAHAKGGSNDISNLRPICRDCNNGMGTENMKEYAKDMFGVDIE